jgi:putative transposase
MESFFALLQKNVLDRQRWDSREQLRLAIITWIERTYHRRRRQRRLGRLTPIEYETINGSLLTLERIGGMPESSGMTCCGVRDDPTSALSPGARPAGGVCGPV